MTKSTGAMIYKSELMSRLKILLRGALSNSRTIGQHLTILQLEDPYYNRMDSSSYRTPNNFNFQIKSSGWSYFMPKNPYIKFQVILTSFNSVLASCNKTTLLCNKVFNFLASLETLLLILRIFPLTLLQDKHDKKDQKCQKTMQSKKVEKK